MKNMSRGLKTKIPILLNGITLLIIIVVIYQSIPQDTYLEQEGRRVQSPEFAAIRNINQMDNSIEDENIQSANAKDDKEEEIIETENKLEKIHKERRTTLMKECDGMEFTYKGNNSDNVIRRHFVYDTEKRIVYCAMEKIGSTFWRRLFQIITGASKAESPFKIPPGAALGGHVKTFAKDGFDHIISVLQTSTKFIFTRDPFVRLLSGYVDKLFSPNTMFWRSIGAYAVRNHRKDATELSRKCGHDLRFFEFVKYFIKSEETNVRRDGHFVPMYDHCRPCQIKYDIIGKMETFEEDTLYILNKLGFSELHDRLSVDFKNQTSDDSFRDQVNHVIGNGGTECLSNYKKQKRMWRKMQIRGMISKHSKFPFTREQSDKVTKQEYYKALSAAVGDAKDPAVANATRWEAIREAYSTIPVEDMLKLQKIFKPDCAVFSYNCDIYKYKPKSGERLRPFYFDISIA